MINHSLDEFDYLEEDNLDVGDLYDIEDEWDYTLDAEIGTNKVNPDFFYGGVKVFDGATLQQDLEYNSVFRIVSNGITIGKIYIYPGVE